LSLTSGTRLGPYEILGPLGAGGMGEVYRARDTRLDRSVAIKVLPAEVASDPERLRRLEHEARAASALNHPNIVTIHDVGREGGRYFLAMELVVGKTLRELLAEGPLPPKRLVAVAAQIADGLAKAHAAGIVHRDLKPANIMVSSDGFVKILDFGLAKRSPPVAEGSQSRAETVDPATDPGQVLGTVGYMSPEQASGRPVDFRSDQFSLGAILYELASGRRAFSGATAIETLSAILKEEPPALGEIRPETPEPLRWITERCLAKDPEERYGSTRDLARDLDRLREQPTGSAPVARGERSRRLRFAIAAALAAGLLAAGILLVRNRAAPEPASASSIAILPFRNISGRAEEEYFSDGMTESLITDLARIPGLLVISRNSVFPYKGKTPDVQEVGRELGVRYVLEGGVQRMGDSVRVSARLLDARSRRHVWTGKYDRSARELFALQDDISRNVAENLKVALRPAAGSSASRGPTESLEAWDLYLRGTSQLNRLEWKEREKGISLLEEAVALDPEFARGHAALAVAYARKAFEGDPDGVWRKKASGEVDRALSLDPNLAEVYLARGSLAWTLEGGFPHGEAIADYRRALELSPNLQPAHKALAGVYYHVGLLDEALDEYRNAARIDPRDADAVYRIPRIHLYQQEYAEALTGFDETPEFRRDFLKPIALAQLGRIEEALSLANSELTSPAHTKAVEQADAASTLAVILALAGDTERVPELVATAAKKGEGNSHFHHASYNIATAYALMGRKPEALDWLERTAREGMPCYPLFEKDPFLKSLRGDARFEALLARTKGQWEGFRGGLKAS
jgi:serine/threonine protein kinase/tetratricopeptide (TPR) repeat protein